MVETVLFLTDMVEPRSTIVDKLAKKVLKDCSPRPQERVDLEGKALAKSGPVGHEGKTGRLPRFWKIPEARSARVRTRRTGNSYDQHRPC